MIYEPNLETDQLKNQNDMIAFLRLRSNKRLKVSYIRELWASLNQRRSAKAKGLTIQCDKIKYY